MVYCIQFKDRQAKILAYAGSIQDLHKYLESTYSKNYDLLLGQYVIGAPAFMAKYTPLRKLYRTKKDVKHFLAGATNYV